MQRKRNTNGHCCLRILWNSGTEGTKIWNTMKWSLKGISVANRLEFLFEAVIYSFTIDIQIGVFCTITKSGKAETTSTRRWKRSLQAALYKRSAKFCRASERKPSLGKRLPARLWTCTQIDMSLKALKIFDNHFKRLVFGWRSHHRKRRRRAGNFSINPAP